MQLLIDGFFLFLGFLILALVAAVIFLHIRYLLAWIKSRKTKRLSYFPYVNSMLTRRSLCMTLVVIPLVLTLFLTLVILASSLVNPHKASKLRQQLRNSTLLKVRTGGFCHRDPAREIDAYQTDDVKQINAFLDRLAFAPTPAGLHCMCCGELSFEFYKNGEMLGAFSLHHDTHIRILDSSSGDIYLSRESCRLLDEWLAEKGVRKIQQELAAKQAEEMEKPFEWGKEDTEESTE